MLVDDGVPSCEIVQGLYNLTNKAGWIFHRRVGIKSRQIVSGLYNLSDWNLHLSGM